MNKGEQIGSENRENTMEDVEVEGDMGAENDEVWID
jgi:hypothetical protein